MPFKKLSSLWKLAPPLVAAFIYEPVFAEASSTLEFERCTVKVGAYERDAECATLLRHENPDDSASKLLELKVVKFPSRAMEPEADAFTVIQGGPGASSIDFATSYLPALDNILKQRDIIVIDQRGTGRSNILACDTAAQEPDTFDPEVVKQLYRECAAELSKENDLRFYTTSVAVDDLESLRQAAGYKQLNFYSVSYGTRVAQHYLRKYPQQTRSVILDGVSHVGINFAGGEIARRWDEGFNALNAKCQQQENCAKAHGDLRETYKKIIKQLEAEPVTVTVPHPKTGELITRTLNKEALFASVRLMAYNTEQLSLIPILLTKTLEGDYRFVLSQIIQTEDAMNNKFAFGMHNSVVCTEDQPFVTEADKAIAIGTLAGTEMADALEATCSVWPAGKMDEDFRQPFKSDIPTLILSGELDPITPPANGEIAASMLENSLHIVVPSHGHGVIARGCVAKLASMFIEAGSVDDLDASCVERERGMPIFSTLAGPTP